MYAVSRWIDSFVNYLLSPSCCGNYNAYHWRDGPDATYEGLQPAPWNWASRL